jgi:hypothetical protein
MDSSWAILRIASRIVPGPTSAWGRSPPSPFVDRVWFWQRSTCYSPKDKHEVFAPSIHGVRVSTKSLKILIAALSSSVAY